LVFAKRTLARCQKFDETGKSCFSDPSLWSVLSAPLPSSDAKSTEGNLCASVAAKSEIFLFFVCVLEYCNMPIFPVNSIILPNNNVLPAFLLVSGVERLKHQKLDRTPFDQGKFAILMIIVLGDVRILTTSV